MAKRKSTRAPARPLKKKFWIGFDLGGTKMLACVLDENYKVIATAKKFQAEISQIQHLSVGSAVPVLLGVGEGVDGGVLLPLAVLEAAPAADAVLAAPAVAAPAPLVNSATVRPGPNTSAPPAQAGPVNSANSR
jgi:hypothetical protein